MHKWGATVMVILIFLHMARTFFFGAYTHSVTIQRKPSRAFPA